jgi:hypothetical protein
MRHEDPHEFCIKQWILFELSKEKEKKQTKNTNQQTNKQV